jgi:hypothetical protein
MEFPTFVYKPKGPGKFKRKRYSYRAVEDEAERQMMLREGWMATREEACGFAPPSPVVEPVVESVVAEVVEEDAPPTRDELEQMAKELGVKFDGRTSDKKLLALIGEKVEGDDGVD